MRCQQFVETRVSKDCIKALGPHYW
uniref:Uncharacterized protein n=1 Tax=Arundo donax TaxID=35708 RepID=A0A0A9EPM1_ARUDO